MYEWVEFLAAHLKVHSFEIIDFPKHDNYTNVHWIFCIGHELKSRDIVRSQMRKQKNEEKKAKYTLNRVL